MQWCQGLLFSAPLNLVVLQNKFKKIFLKAIIRFHTVNTGKLTDDLSSNFKSHFYCIGTELNGTA